MTYCKTDLDYIYRRVNFRLLPFLGLCYLINYLDRINISFAKLQMQSDLSLSDAVYGIAAGIFFLGYVLFEIPSNLLMAKIGARKTIGRIVILWGVISISTLFVTDVTSFYVMRFLLGVAEAGFTPGVLFCFTSPIGIPMLAWLVQLSSYYVLGQLVL